MKRLLALLLLPACTLGERAESGKCPDGEVCSPKTPGGLDFVGANLAGTLFAGGPSATAIGGTQKIEIKYDPNNTGWRGLDLPYKAEAAGPISIVDQTAAIVTVTGAGTGDDYLRIVDPRDKTLFDRKLIGAGAIGTIQLIPTDLEVVPAGDVAWASNTTEIGVALYDTSASTRLVDESMTLSLSGTHQMAWDTLRVDSTLAQLSTLTITAAGKTMQTDIVVTDTADSVGPMDAPAAVAPNTPAEVCFSASARQRSIVGLRWTFTVDGGPGQTTLFPNCVGVKTTKTTGTVSITASAGGQSATLQLPVSAMARATMRKTRELPTTAGERAAM